MHVGHRLLERDELLAQLKAHADAASRREGRMVFLGGEAGVGKTSLVESHRRWLGQRWLVLKGACEPMTAPRPLGPLFDLAAAVSPEFEELIDSGADSHRLFASLLAQLRDTPTPCALIFEDLHWADDATLDLLRYLGRRIADCPALILATYRDDEPGPTQSLRRLLGDLAGSSTMHRITVPPLSLAAVEDLASELTVDPVELHRRTNGNPFFVTEVLALAGEGVPERVSDAIFARVSRLSPEARRAVELAAVIVDQNLAAGVLGKLEESAKAIDECVGAGLLSSSDGRLSFRHQLVREAVIALMPAGTLQAAHATVLAALEEEKRQLLEQQDVRLSAEYLAVLAYHAAEAGDGEAVLRYAPAAGRLAMKFRAFTEARIQFARALPFADALSLEDHAALLTEHAVVCVPTDRFDEAIASRRAAARLFSGPEHVERRAESIFHLAWLLCWMYRDEEAAAQLDMAEDLLKDLPASRVNAFIAFMRGWQIYPRGEPSLRLAKVSEALAIKTGQRNLVIYTKFVAGPALCAMGRIKAAKRERERAMEIAAELEAQHMQMHCYFSLSTGLAEAYRYLEADRGYQQVEVLSREHDFDFTYHYSLGSHALAYLHLGRWQEAHDAATVALSRDRGATMPRLWARLALGRLSVRRIGADPDGHLEAALELADSTPRMGVAVRLRAARAEAALARGDKDAALAEASLAFERALAEGSAWHISELAYWIWRAGGEPSLPPGTLGPFAWQLRGRPAIAARRWRRLCCPYEQASALSEAGDQDSLMEALALFSRLGAGPAADRVADELKRMGVRGLPRGPTPATQAHPVGLTPRERQILEFLAMGLRNADITERNRVSVRTIDHQVSAVLGKLGVKSRTEAVSEAHRLGLLAKGH